jgi:hypothetical protein
MSMGSNLSVNPPLGKIVLELDLIRGITKEASTQFYCTLG